MHSSPGVSTEAETRPWEPIILTPRSWTHESLSECQVSVVYTLPGLWWCVTAAQMYVRGIYTLPVLWWLCDSRSDVCKRDIYITRAMVVV